MTSSTIFKNSFKRFKKQSERGKVLAVVGTSRGVGVTHFAIQLATYYAKQRLRVALVELHHHQHFEKIEKAYEGIHFDQHKTQAYKIKGVMYYKSCQKDNLLKIYQEPYDCIILDMGASFEGFQEEVLRADQSLIIGRIIDWKLDEIDNFKEKYDHLMTARWEWIFPFAKLSDLREISKKLKMSCHGMPFSEDPFVRVKVVDQAINIICKDEV